MPRHIGIVAVSPEGSSFCYRMIGRLASEIQDAARRPMITLHNQPFSSYVEALERGDWNAIGDLLRDSSEALARAGADFCVLPDNVAHHALPLVEGRCALPWLNMIELVAEAVHTNQCRTVGLIGTKYVMNGSTYQSALGLKGIHLFVPEAEEGAAIDRIIFTEAVYGRVRAESRQLVRESIARLAGRGCDAVILGTTEASLLMAVEDSPLPLFDPVELLANAAVQHALPGREPVAGPAAPLAE